jgi:multidrug transporter EmrE-like cation transporter
VLEAGRIPASVVFPIVNVGVVLLSALGGWLLFSERLSPRNMLGVALAVVAIWMIAFSS